MFFSCIDLQFGLLKNWETAGCKLEILPRNQWKQTDFHHSCDSTFFLKAGWKKYEFHKGEFLKDRSGCNHQVKKQFAERQKRCGHNEKNITGSRHWFQSIYYRAPPEARSWSWWTMLFNFFLIVLIKCKCLFAWKLINFSEFHCRVCWICLYFG